MEIHGIMEIIAADNVEWRCSIMSTVLVVGGFAAVLIAKWNYYSKFYSHK